MILASDVARPVSADTAATLTPSSKFRYCDDRLAVDPVGQQHEGRGRRLRTYVY